MINNRNWNSINNNSNNNNNNNNNNSVKNRITIINQKNAKIPTAS